MRFLTWSLAAALSMATWHLSGPVNAQTQSPSPPALSGPSPNIPDKKLDAAAAAVERVEFGYCWNRPESEPLRMR
jgi:hypothetical protein